MKPGRPGRGPRPRRSRVVVALGAAALGASGLVAVLLLPGGPWPPPWRTTVDVSVTTPDGAAVRLEGLVAAPAADPGPLADDSWVASPWVARPGEEFSWGLLTLSSPDERTFTVLSAEAVTDRPGAALVPGYAASWPRGIGAVQIAGWPPRPESLTVTPRPLPVQVPGHGRSAAEGPEIFVGLRVPEGGVTMTGIDVRYTDGRTLWTMRVDHRVTVCTRGTVAQCQESMSRT